MVLSVWDLFKYLYKWKAVIAIVTVLAYFGVGSYVEKKQTYSAKVIIQYTDSCIGQGKTLDGNTFDVNEIKAPTVILNVLNELGYSKKKIDSVREHIHINAITPTSVNNLKESKEKLGEEYRYFPKTFTITYDGNSSFEETRDILNSIVANYFKYYSEKYLYMATLNEIDYNVNKKNFDYIEQAEQIQDNLNQTITSLENYAKDSGGYRSPTTGLTFDDLLKDFKRINEYALPHIFSKIYEGQISKDKRLLIDKYTQRLEQNELETDTLQNKAKLAEDRMNAYVDANVAIQGVTEYDKTNNFSNVIDDIRDYREDVNVQTTYDDLMKSYTDDSIAASSKKLDAAYYQTVIDKFKGARYANSNYEELEKEVETEIESLLSSLEDLYKKANINISNYNAYIPALHIKKLSGVGYYVNLSASLYRLIALIAGFGLSCVGAISYEVVKKYAIYGRKEETLYSDEEEFDKEGAEV